MHFVKKNIASIDAQLSLLVYGDGSFCTDDNWDGRET